MVRSKEIGGMQTRRFGHVNIRAPRSSTSDQLTLYNTTVPPPLKPDLPPTDVTPALTSSQSGLQTLKDPLTVRKFVRTRRWVRESRARSIRADSPSTAFTSLHLDFTSRSTSSADPLETPTTNRQPSSFESPNRRHVEPDCRELNALP